MALATALAGWDLPATSQEGARVYEELAQASTLAKNYLFPCDIATSRSAKSKTPDVTAAFGLLLRAGQAPLLYQDFLDVMESRFYLIKNDITRFINALQETAAVSVEPQTQIVMAEMFERLASWQRAWGLPLRALEDPKIMNSFTSLFQQHLYSLFTSTFPVQLRDFLATSLASLPEHLLNPEPRLSLLQTIVPSTQLVPSPSPHFHRLGVFPRYASTLMRVAYDEIERISREEARQGWAERRLPHARQRVSDSVVNWIAGVLESHDNPQNMMRPIYSRFDYYLCKCFFDIRTDELFDIIVDFPDSMAALEDLKDCLFKVDHRGQLVDKLLTANIKRLLHPGAETKDVITQYISTIRCLRILDPPGVLLHKVAAPIRYHLRGRSNTIRCIIAALVEGEELQDENDPASAQPLSATNDDTVENFMDQKWEPEPIDAAPEFRSGTAADIVGTLVSIYDTRDAIIKGLQVFLATRMLAIKDYDSVREIRTIELLKIRFGEEALHVCDVMLKDMADSKRIDDHVHGDIESVVHPLIISRMFWPTIQASSLRLTPKLEEAQAKYEAAFHHFKPDKRLRWLQHMGTVNVKLELADRVVETEATPLQAAVIELFESAAQWAELDLANKLSANTLSIQNVLLFWDSLGVLRKEAGGAWRLLEIAEAADGER